MHVNSRDLLTHDSRQLTEICGVQGAEHAANGTCEEQAPKCLAAAGVRMVICYE